MALLKTILIFMVVAPNYASDVYLLSVNESIQQIEGSINSILHPQFLVLISTKAHSLRTSMQCLDPNAPDKSQGGVGQLQVLHCTQATVTLRSRKLFLKANVRFLESPV
ncbi:hypothetical protein AC1031_021960 [Aphanomyces cochlioides]|nr:hypothetical protein AC1031_021960 [Aphanomyces cochlioides]